MLEQNQNNLNNTAVTKLAKYGLAGVCVALVLLAAFIINGVFNFMGNHIKGNTEALIELKASIESSTKASDSQAEAFNALKDAIIQMKIAP